MSAVRKPSLLERAAARYDYRAASGPVGAAALAAVAQEPPAVALAEPWTPARGRSDGFEMGAAGVLPPPAGAVAGSRAAQEQPAVALAAPWTPARGRGDGSEMEAGGVPSPPAGAVAGSRVAQEAPAGALAEPWTPARGRGDGSELGAGGVLSPPAGAVAGSRAAQEPLAGALAEPWSPARGQAEGVADTLAAIPAEFLAQGGEDEDPVFPAPDPAVALVDRGMLAESGMIVPGAPVGALAEEFRLVKRQLLVTRHRIAEPEHARTVLVCSARPGDGKTFCAINLALSLAAERDLEVLLVDADVAKPDVPRRLGLGDGPGLLDALADPAIDPEALVRRTDVPQLSVLTAGTRTTTDTELLASARTRTVLSRLLDAEPRRLVVFDSPPALAASPAGVLAMLVGQVMLVVRADRTPESDLRAAVQLLDGCEHIQLMLNAVSFVPGGQRYGAYGQEA